MFSFFVFFFLGTFIYLNPRLPGQAWTAIFPQLQSTSVSIVEGSTTPFALTSGEHNNTSTPDPTFTPDGTALPLTSTQMTPTLKAILSATPQGGGTGQIAFVSDRTGKMQIWLMNADGSGLIQLTNIPDGACQPAWAPDGQKLAFISPCNEKLVIYESSKIYVTDLEGKVDDFSFSQAGDFDPAWSPDGKRLAFTSLRTGIAHVFVYQFEDDTIHELSDTRFPDMEPSWSPNGSQIAVSRTNFYTHIYIISDRGFTQFKFSSSGNINDYWADWSPDGAFLIFSRASEDPSIPLLYRLNYDDRDAGKEIRISSTSDEPSPVSHADLSPDGRWVILKAGQMGEIMISL